MSDPLRVGWALGFEASPIILQSGIVANLPGASLPILTLLQPAAFLAGIVNPAGPLDMDDIFAKFKVIPGGTLEDFEVGTYPFANMAVAANAMIANGIRISLQMNAPALGPLGWATKLATITALKATLDQHQASGGTYIVATPSYIYQNCLLIRLADSSSGESKQPQASWQWDFYAPLITLQQAQQVLGSLMSKINSGLPIQGQPAYSGLGPPIGVPQSGALPSVIPSANSLPGASVPGQGSIPTTDLGGLS